MRSVALLASLVLVLMAATAEATSSSTVYVPAKAKRCAACVGCASLADPKQAVLCRKRSCSNCPTNVVIAAGNSIVGAIGNKAVVNLSSGDVIINANLTVQGTISGLLPPISNLDLPGTLDVDGDASFSQDVVVNGDLTIDGALNVDNLDLPGTLNVDGVSSLYRE